MPCKTPFVRPNSVGQTPSRWVVAALTLLACGGAFANPVLTPGQSEAASRVYLGIADCEFKQQIVLSTIPDRPGHFRLQHLKASYVMVPQETSTGAVRLEDPHNGIVWLQIPAKSMLMNAKLGRRLVDACQTIEQRSAHPVLQ